MVTFRSLHFTSQRLRFLSRRVVKVLSQESIVEQSKRTKVEGGVNVEEDSEQAFQPDRDTASSPCHAHVTASPLPRAIGA